MIWIKNAFFNKPKFNINIHKIKHKINQEIIIHCNIINVLKQNCKNHSHKNYIYKFNIQKLFLHSFNPNGQVDSETLIKKKKKKILDINLKFN
jgi:hypothetical protein